VAQQCGALEEFKDDNKCMLYIQYLFPFHCFFFGDGKENQLEVLSGL